MKNNEEFFDEVSSYYNEMVSFDEALIKREKVLKNFANDKMKTAADIGCGTGLDSLSLAKIGLTVTAFDLSAKMLEIAANKAGERGLNINFVKSSADAVPGEYHGKYALVVSLGNTFANLDERQLNAAIEKCHNLLTEDGVLLIQVLNFDRILKDKERIVNITRSGNYYYTRFYDFTAGEIIFNILRFNADNTSERDLVSTKLYPHSYQKIQEYLQDTGFIKVNMWGNFNREGFEPTVSKDLIVEAFK